MVPLLTELLGLPGIDVESYSRFNVEFYNESRDSQILIA